MDLAPWAQGCQAHPREVIMYTRWLYSIEAYKSVAYIYKWLQNLFTAQDTEKLLRSGIQGKHNYLYVVCLKSNAGAIKRLRTSTMSIYIHSRAFSVHRWFRRSGSSPPQTACVQVHCRPIMQAAGLHVKRTFYNETCWRCQLQTFVCSYQVLSTNSFLISHWKQPLQ